MERLIHTLYFQIVDGAYFGILPCCSFDKFSSAEPGFQPLIVSLSSFDTLI